MNMKKRVKEEEKEEEEEYGCMQSGLWPAAMPQSSLLN
jgi:hypothetical protein